MRIDKIFSLIVIGLGFLSSCGGNNSEKTNSPNSTDSLRIMEEMLEKERQQTEAHESVLQEKAKEAYERGISIIPGKKVTRHIDEATCNDVKWTCNITNDTGITLSPDDYQISYQESYEGQNKYGDLVDKKKTQTMKGPELAKDATEEVVLKGKECTYDLTLPAVKLTISKEDFIKKYIEQNN